MTHIVLSGIHAAVPIALGQHDEGKNKFEGVGHIDPSQHRVMLGTPLPFSNGHALMLDTCNVLTGIGNAY